VNVGAFSNNTQVASISNLTYTLGVYGLVFDAAVLEGNSFAIKLHQFAFFGTIQEG
jgi:hypothetical protein